ncbi:MAG: uroporphyrinogen-III synthase [Chloroflexota bacterium]|nr:uroporphyrinogen-III synthase [Chloroflexota bacterium]
MNGLSGKRIVITRALDQAGELADLLRERGASPVFYPCIAVAPPDDFAPLDAALRRLASDDYDWLIVTSVNAVNALADRAAALTIDLSDAQIAVVGAATAAALATRLQLKPAFVPAAYRASALAQTLPRIDAARILIPHSDLAPDALGRALTLRGACVDAVTAYRTVRGQGGVHLTSLLLTRQLDALTFTSSSAVRYFYERIADEGGCCYGEESLPSACLGQPTAQTAREHGLSVAVVAPNATLSTFIDHLESYFAAR